MSNEINCEKVKKNIGKLKTLKSEFLAELERIKKDGNAGNIYELKKEIEVVKGFLDVELKEFFSGVKIDISKYKNIGDPQNINGKIAFWAKTETGKYIIISEKGQIGDEYKDIGDPQNISGKIAFRAKTETGKYIIMSEKGQIGDEYKKTGNPQNINGKIAFRAKTETGKYIIMSGKGQVGDEYDEIYDIFEKNGRMVVIGKIKNKIIRKYIKE